MNDSQIDSQIVLQFSTESAFSSWLIRYLTWSDFSHVDIVLPDGALLGARTDGGVKIRPNNYDKFSDVIRFAIPCTAEQALAVLAAAKSQIGKHYDWLGIINFLTHRNWRDMDSWFCSELAAWSCEQGNLYLLNKYVEVRRITPQAALSSCRLELVPKTAVTIICQSI